MKKVRIKIDKMTINVDDKKVCRILSIKNAPKTVAIFVAITDKFATKKLFFVERDKISVEILVDNLTNFVFCLIYLSLTHR